MNEKRRTLLKLYAVIFTAIGLIFVPGFLAWKEEHHKRIQIEEEINKIKAQKAEDDYREAVEARSQLCADFPVGASFEVQVHRIEGRFLHVSQVSPLKRPGQEDVHCGASHPLITLRLRMSVEHLDDGQSEVCLDEFRRPSEAFRSWKTGSCMALIASTLGNGISIGGNAVVLLKQKPIHIKMVPEQILASLREEAKQVPSFPEKIETFPNEQAKKLTLSAAKQRDDLSPLLVGIFGSQNMAYGLGVVDAFRSAGVKASDTRISPDTAQQSGILISCDTSEHAEKKRAALASVLEDAGLHYRETEMISEAKAYGVDGCFLYLGPTE